VFQGHKTISLASEMFDYRQYLPDSQLKDDLTHFTLENSYSVEMLEPGRVFRLRYDDPERKNRYDLLYTAVAAPMVWPSSRHYEQVMRVEGDLLLRGRSYRVGGYNVRDRSWGEARLENPNPGPPNLWTTGTFGDDFAFNVTAYDDPLRNPLWKDRFPVESHKALKFGWLMVDGEATAIKSASNITHYDRATLIPTSMEMEVTDVKGRVFDIKGMVIASVPLNTWLNLRVPICSARWTCNGRIGYGDIQEAQWTDYLQAYHPFHD
jgi:hypothetical protein